MPKMFIHAPQGTFDVEARVKVADALTDLGLRCEALPHTAFVRSTVWIYFNDYAGDAVFSGGKPATSKVMSLLVYAIDGGLDARGKQELIAGATATRGRRAAYRPMSSSGRCRKAIGASSGRWPTCKLCARRRVTRCQYSSR